MIDGHIHYAESMGWECLEEIITQYGYRGAALLCLPKGDEVRTEEDAFAFRERSKVPVYVFGGLDRALYSLKEEVLGERLAAEAERLMEMGCTGIKMLEGKPNVRKKWAVPDFDRPVWEQYWQELEKKQIPVYMHVNDPEEFWDERKVSEFAKKSGWFYDSTYVKNEEQYRQMEQVLMRHPDLRILFPHFFFLSKQLERLGGILKRFPNVYIDVTPGVELYYNLSEQKEKAREFFYTFQDRICFGTDIGGRAVIQKEDVPLSMEESRARISLITRFLEEKGDYILHPDGYYVTGNRDRVMHGLGLEKEILDKVYEENFLAFIQTDRGKMGDRS